MPVFPTPAFQAKNEGDMGIFLDYTALWSILHYPQGVVPITEVEQGEEEFTDKYNDLWT